MEGRPLWLAALALVALAGESQAQARRAVPAPAASARADAHEPELDNVLILVADDLGVDMLRSYRAGSDAPPTPNLDRLAANGVLFRHVWAQPTCSPTRATLQTGRYAFRTTIGQVINPSTGGPALPTAELTLPEMLDLGTGGRYAHAAIGKWHLGTSQVGGTLAPNLAGYAHYAGSIEGQIPSYGSWTKVVDGQSSYVTRYATSENVDDALAWIGQQAGPWLCYVAFQAPHAPFHRPPPALHTRVLPPGEPRSSCTDPDGNDPRPYVAAMIEALDTEIGRLLAGIPPVVRARTTVIFLGDNGSVHCLDTSSTGAKGTLYEGGIRVPFIVAGSRVVRPGVCRALVNTTDVFATVAEIAGVDLPQVFPGVQLDSVSLVPYLRQPELPSIRRRVHAQSFTPNGPGNPVPLPRCPAASVCQADLGFDGPGDAELEICGLPLYGLYGANTVPLVLRGAPPGAQATLRIGSYAPAFVPQLGATVVSSAPAAELSYQADAQGAVATSVWAAAFPAELHYQMVVADPAQPAGHSVSNAVRIDPLWTDMRAVRNARYKLIRFHPCKEELYDLVQDPREQTDLLALTLGREAFAAYSELARELDRLH